MARKRTEVEAGSGNAFSDLVFEKAKAEGAQIASLRAALASWLGHDLEWTDRSSREKNSGKS